MAGRNDSTNNECRTHKKARCAIAINFGTDVLTVHRRFRDPKSKERAKEWAEEWDDTFIYDLKILFFQHVSKGEREKGD